MKFLSLFAGIGGFDLALTRSGMECIGQVECDENCNRVLARNFPDTSRHADVGDFSATNSVSAIRPDCICGGFPCQDLSVAGKRAGLAGARSGLFFEFARIAYEYSPPARWVLVENVPGLLSSNEGEDFAVILEALTGIRFEVPRKGWRGIGYATGPLYGVAWRVLDAQWFGVAQARRRVFIVGCFGSVRRAAEVLFESESLPWDSPPRRKKRKDVARCVATGTNPSRFDGDTENFVVAGQCHGSDVGSVSTLRRGNGSVQSGIPFVAHTLRADGHDASEDGTGRGTPLVAVIAFDTTQITSAGNYSNPQPGNPCHPLASTAHPPASATSMAVRRLTPRECERLMGLPDDWTRFDADGKELSDSARYKMCGNSVAIPVIEWIGRRMVEVDSRISDRHT